VIDLFVKGGPLMYAILGCSVIAWAIFFERLWCFHRAQRHMEPLTTEVLSLCRADKIEQAATLCDSRGGVLARLLVPVLTRAEQDRDQIKAQLEEVAAREVAALDRYLGLLGTIATIAPLLGLLGTVIGMIRAFNVIAAEGVGTPATLGGGISEALITTAAGLSVAVPVILLHRYLTSRVDRLTLELEENAMKIVDQVGG